MASLAAIGTRFLPARGHRGTYGDRLKTGKENRTVSPLRVVVIAELGTDWMDWERRLFASVAESPQLEFVGVRAPAGFRGSQQSSLMLRNVLAAEAKVVSPARGPASDYAPPAAAADMDADVALCHLRGGWPDDPGAAELWGYDVLSSGALQALGVAETLRNAPITQIALLRHGAGGQDCLAISDTNTKICASFTAAYALDKLVPVVVRALRRRQRGADVGSAPLPATPHPVGSLQLPRYAAVVAARLVRRAVATIRKRRGARLSEWTLLVAEGDPLTFKPNALRPLPQPPEDSRADPFLFPHEGETWVFYEAFSHRTGLGRLGVGRLSGDRLTDTRELDLGPGHLSYPFVFRHEGKIWMIPETNDRGRVEVWRCEAFPDRWVRHTTALEGLAPADSTLIQHGSDWWLMANLSSGAFVDQGQELHLFRTDGPALSWLEPHVDNPVVIGTTAARNAGRPFLRDGGLYRPVQVSSHGTYGRQLRLMRVDRLDRDAYQESCLRVIRPDETAGTNGCHHIDFDGKQVILDARRMDGGRALGASGAGLIAEP